MSALIDDLAKSALADAAAVAERLDADSFESLAQAIANAKTIAFHGLGCEGLQMRRPCHVCELLVPRLRDIKGETPTSMRKRHTNME